MTSASHDAPVRFPGKRARVVAAGVLGLGVLILIIAIWKSDDAASIRGNVEPFRTTGLSEASSSQVDDQPHAHAQELQHAASPESESSSATRPSTPPPVKITSSSDEAATVIQAIAACAASYGARDWEEVRSCHESVKAMIAALTEQGQYDLAQSLSDDELKEMILVIVLRPVPNTTYVGPIHRMEQYPSGLLKYMLEVAAGEYGTERMRLSLGFFWGCRDCPPVAFQPACEVLRARENPRAMTEAILQLRHAPGAIGEGELLQILAAPGHVDQKGPALQTLSKRGSPATADAVYALVSSANLEDVSAGVQGLQGLLRHQPELVTEVVEARLVEAIDSIYSVLSDSQRLSVFVAFLALPQGAAHLRTLANGEPDPTMAQLIRDAALDLENGVPRDQIQSKLVKMGKNK